MKRNIPPWPKLATVQYWILSLILYLISMFALFAVPYPQFSNGMAALKCSPHFRNHNHILAHLGLFSLCFASEWDWKSYLAQIQLVVSLLYPITGLSRLDPPPARPPPDWASLYTLHSTLTLCRPPHIHILGINFLFVQPEPWPPNFFMEISQGPVDISQNTF